MNSNFSVSCKLHNGWEVPMILTYSRHHLKVLILPLQRLNLTTKYLLWTMFHKYDKIEKESAVQPKDNKFLSVKVIKTVTRFDFLIELDRSKKLFALNNARHYQGVLLHYN